MSDSLLSSSNISTAMNEYNTGCLFDNANGVMNKNQNKKKPNSHSHSVEFIQKIKKKIEEFDAECDIVTENKRINDGNNVKST